MRILVGLIALLIAVVSLEGGVRLFGIDQRLLRRGLFHQQADLPVHQCSNDPQLHYELRPGAQFTGTGPGGQPYNVSIDESGARRPAHPRQKGPGVFRILCLGGSTMYGAGVEDGETIPARLEARLNALSPASSSVRYEAWNFGTSAYVLRQVAQLARQQMTSLQPDLILIQMHNVGRRPFLASDECSGVDPTQDADAGRRFFLEQFPAPRWIGEELHLKLAMGLAVYRSFLPLTVGVADGSPCAYCDALDVAAAEQLLQEAAEHGVPVRFIALPADRGQWPRMTLPERAASMTIDLYRPDREPDFYEVHPPAPILDEYAGGILEALRGENLLGEIGG